MSLRRWSDALTTTPLFHLRHGTRPFFSTIQPIYIRCCIIVVLLRVRIVVVCCDSFARYAVFLHLGTYRILCGCVYYFPRVYSIIYDALVARVRPFLALLAKECLEFGLLSAYVELCRTQYNAVPYR